MKNISIVILFLLAIVVIGIGVFLFVNKPKEQINIEEDFDIKDNYSLVVTNFSDKSKIYIAMSKLQEKNGFSNLYRLEDVKAEINYFFGDIRIDFENVLQDDLIYSYNQDNKTISISPIDSEGFAIYQEKINTTKEKNKVYVDFCILKFISTNEITREENEPYEIKIYTKTDLVEEELIHAGRSDGENFFANAIEDEIDAAQIYDYKSIMQKHMDDLPKVRYTFEKYENRYIISNIELI